MALNKGIYIEDGILKVKDIIYFDPTRQPINISDFFVVTNTISDTVRVSSFVVANPELYDGDGDGTNPAPNAACALPVNCTGLTTKTIDVNQNWQGGLEVIHNCHVADIDTDQTLQNAVNALTSTYRKKWLVNEITIGFTTLSNALAPAIITAEDTNILDVVQTMIDSMLEQGYTEDQLTVSFNNKTAGKYKRLGWNCCYGVSNTATETLNPWGVNRVLNGRTFQTDDIMVYVTDYAKLGRKCVMVPRGRDGVNEYDGRLLFGGEENFGFEMWLDEIGVKYTYPTV